MKTHLTPSDEPSSTRLGVFLFLVLWFSYGAVINSSNLLEFNLQHIGVEAMVERGNVYLEDSTSPHLQLRGDFFEYKGHQYAAKQPGQFIAGAVVYFLLHTLGLSYVTHYLLTSALVTFFTTSLVLAVSSVALFGIAREMSVDRVGLLPPARPARMGTPLFWPLAATLSYALASTAFSYSGVAHHDALATGYLVIAFYLILQLSRRNVTKRASYLKAAGAGLLLGLTITTSMLPCFMVVVCALYFLSLRRSEPLPVFLVGLLAGLLPLFVYDAVNFGNPFLLPNIAGNYSDTYFHFSQANLGNKLGFYAQYLIFFAPIFLLGLFGLSCFPLAIKREPHFLALVAMLIVIAVHLLNIRSDGDCQFGPRYLLPAMPFASLGIAGYSHLSTANKRRFAGFIVVGVMIVSFGINLVGAMQGALNCFSGSEALTNHLAAMMRGNWNSYPLAPWLAAPLAICLTLFALSLRKKYGKASSYSATRLGP